MASYLAHISDDGREQTVKAHLDGTAELCRGFAGAFGAGELAWMIGEATDAPKRTCEVTLPPRWDMP